jgi:ABC-type taurine transport system substrate-binding protein
MTEKAQTDRRGFLKLAGTGVGGLVVGGIIGAALAPPSQPTVTTQTVTQTQTLTAALTKPIPTQAMVAGNTGGAAALNHYVAESEMARLRSLGYNIKMELLETAAAPAALVSGSTPFMYGNFDQVAPIVRDQPGSVFAFTETIDGSYPIWLIIAKKGVKFEDFVGNPNLRFGVSRIGVASQLLPAYDYTQLGLDPMKVNWVAVGGTGARLAALQSGQIDAGLAYTDLALTTVQAAPDKFAIIGPPQTEFAWWWTSKNFADNNPEVLKDVIRAQLWVVDQINQTPETWFEGGIRWIKQDYNDQIRKEWQIVYDYFFPRILTAVSEDQRTAQLKKEVQINIEAGALTQPIDPSVIYNNKLYLEVLKEQGYL